MKTSYTFRDQMNFCIRKFVQDVLDTANEFGVRKVPASGGSPYDDILIEDIGDDLVQTAYYDRSRRFIKFRCNPSGAGYRLESAALCRGAFVAALSKKLGPLRVEVESPDQPTSHVYVYTAEESRYMGD